MTNKKTSFQNEEDTIAIFLGLQPSFNVKRTVIGLGEILKDQFSLDLVTTNPEALPEEANTLYNIFGADHSSTHRGGFAALNSYLKTHSPIALTYVIRPPTTGCIAAILAKRHGVPFIYRHSGETFRDYTLFDSYEKMKIFTLKNIIGRVPLKLATKYVAIGPAGKYQLMYKGVSPSDIYVLPPPVDVTRFENASGMILNDIPNEAPVVLFVGRKSRLKGIESLESAIPKVLERRPEMHFLLVGGGEDIQVPDEYKSNVHEVGKVPPDQIPGYFDRADLLVHPSLTEGFGRVLVEAIATETPILARAIGDMPSITSNTFVTESGLIENICNYERLYVNDADRFAPRNLQAPYVEFFNQFRSLPDN